MNASLARRVRHAETFLLATLGSTQSARQFVNSPLRAEAVRPSCGRVDRHQRSSVADSYPIYKDAAPARA
jgi:hypothetical protein